MTQFTPLPRSFYQPSASAVARALLGHWLVRLTKEGYCGGAIVETEAYLRGDPACHATPGLTKRNRVMFGPPGHAYVYFIYGCHYCVNAVCRPPGLAEAVLIRAIEPTFGQHILEGNRTAAQARCLTNGPAKLCEAMHIDLALDGTDLCNSESPLLIARNPDGKQFKTLHGPVVTTTRIGISRAPDSLLRFYLDGNGFVSRRVGARNTRYQAYSLCRDLL